MYIKTLDRIKVEDYPYSFTLRTTLFDSVEFNPRKGYRHVQQTINPKTGKYNKEKKGTYSPLLVRYRNEEGHIKCTSYDFNGSKEINRGCRFIAENFDLFTTEEIKYLYARIHFAAFVDMKALVIYGGSEPDQLKIIYEGLFKAVREGKATGKNHFLGMILDLEAIEATKPKNFDPFKMKEVRACPVVPGQTNMSGWFQSDPDQWLPK